MDTTKFRRVTAGSLVAGLLATVLPWTMDGRADQGQSGLPAAAQADRLTSPSRPAESLVVMQRSPRTGAAAFAGGGTGLSLDVDAAAPVETRARAFVSAFGAGMGVTDDAQLSLRTASTDALGIEHARFQQVHLGVPVTAGEMIVHVRGATVVAANGRILDAMPVDVAADIGPAAALAAARTVVAKYRQAESAGASYSQPRLEVFNRGFLEDRGGITRLAWFVEATNRHLREFIWIDADLGGLLLNFSQLPDAKNRQTYTAGGTGTLPGTLVRSEGQGPAGDADTDNAHDFAGHTYDYFSTHHGRDSFDDAGATLISTVHFNDGMTCPNAFWDGTQMVYCDGFSQADDVVAHELTHAVTEHSANLFYYYQSGALNESFSDIFGETVDLGNGAGSDGPGNRWQVGEDLPVFGVIRNMSDPTIFGDPGKMSDPEFLCSDQGFTNPFHDSGGVHINSGVPNHAYALMVDGGSYNGHVVAGIGLAKAEIIQYRALTQYLTSGSTFLDNYNALIQSCTDLIGTAGISAGDCTQVTEAVEAVEMNDTWSCSGAVPFPPLCANGAAPSTVFFDGFESGIGNWSPQPNWDVTEGFAKDGIWSAWGLDPAGVTDQSLPKTAAVALPANAFLAFDHAYEFESDGALGSNNYDGGVIEYSINGGGTWVDGAPLIDGGRAYGGTIRNAGGNPLGGRSGFVRASYGYTRTRLSLASLSGQNFLVRFRIGTDVIVGSLGWLVDNVRIYTCPGQQLTANPTVVNFGATKNGAGGALVSVTPNQVVTVGFVEPPVPPDAPPPAAPPNWTATANQSWVSVTGGSGTGAGQFTVGIVNPGNVIGGATSLDATVTISAPDAAPVQVAVHLAVQQSVGSSADPFGQVDAPAQNATGLQGAVGVSGWVLDDIAVQDVHIYRNCLAFDPGGACQMVGGHNVVFIGTAAFVAGARPDVAAAFPTSPQKDRAGWGLQILTNMLPHVPNELAFGGQGTLQFFAFANDVDGHQTLLGRTFMEHTPTTVTLDNENIAKPFGTLDTPGQGQTVSGLVPNFGWALTPDTDTVAGAGDILIPTDGSTMFVFIDGMLVSPVTYNQCRGTVGNPPPGGVFCDDDVANIFGNPTPQPPGTPRTSNPTKYRNLDAGRGVIGSYLVDTGPLANGLHSIAWSVRDSADRLEGIGSRNFIVLNGGGAPPPAPAMTVADWLTRPAASVGVVAELNSLRLARRTLAGRTGFDPGTSFTVPRRHGASRVAGVATMNRLELHLGGPVSSGYLVNGDDLRQLPPGSVLDAASGVFTWAPPLGYRGDYQLVFVAGAERIPVAIRVGAERPGIDR